MKGVFVVLVFLVLVGGVSAMNGPIRVMTDSGNRVSVFIWTSGGGPILNSGTGIADSDGVFVTETFFSLRAPYKFNVVILDSDLEAITFNKEIAGLGFDDGMDVDCRSGSCIVSASEVLAEVVNESDVEVIVNESNDSVVVEIVGEDVSVEGDDAVDVSLTGKALFFKEDGSINWVYSGGGIIVLLLFFVFIFMMFHRGGSKKVVDDDERELEDMEKKVKDAGEKIQKVKEGKVKRTKIYEAKLKLAEEEKELSELEGRNDEKIEAQERVVEKAGDIVDKAEDSGGEQ